MKKFLILLSAGTAFAFASCSHSSGSCCGTCGGDKKACTAKTCCGSDECKDCDSKKD